MQLVKDGKLSPEDASELIEAFNDAPDEVEPIEEVNEEAGDSEPSAGASEAKEETGSIPPKVEGSDPFSKFIGSIEKLTKDVAKNVDWQDISEQVRTGVNKGVDAVKQAADQASKGRGPFGSMFGAKERTTVELPLAVPEGKTFVIDGRECDVVITGGHDLGSLKIEAGFKAFSEDEAIAAKDKYMPSLEENDDEVVLRNADPTGVVAQIDVKLPTGVPIRINNMNGGIKISGVHGSVKIRNASGDIVVSDAKGLIDIATSRGLTKVVNSEGKKIDLESKSGDIVVDRTSGPLALKTSSGDIYAYDVSARTVAAEAASGDIKMDFKTPVEGSYNVRTVSGDIQIGLPDGNDCRVSLSTLRGVAGTNFELIDGVVDGMKVVGRLGEGNGVLDVSAVNGDVSLNLRGSEVKDS